MIYKSLIEELYIDKDNQRRIKAYTLDSSASIFNYSLPVSLTQFAVDNQSQISKFQLVFYTKNKFESEFSSRNNMFKIKENNLNRFSEEIDQDLFTSTFNKNMSISHYYNDDIEHDGIYEVDFNLNRYFNQRLKYYEIILNQNDSRDIKNNNYTALKIFLIDTDNNIIDEIDFNYFDSNFFTHVYDNVREINTLKILRDGYFNDIERSLDLYQSSSVDWSVFFRIPDNIYDSRHEDGSYIFSEIVGSISYDGLTSRTSILDTNRRTYDLLSPQTPYASGSELGIILPEFFDFFKDIFYDYHRGQRQFNITLNLQISVRPSVNSDEVIEEIFEKNITLNRNSDFIKVMITSSAEASIISRELSSISFNINTEIFPNYIKLNISKDAGSRCLEFIKIKNIKLFKDVSSNFYLDSSLSKNTEIDLIGKKLSSQFGESNNFTLYAANNINFLEILPKIELAYLTDSDDRDARNLIEAREVVFNKTDYKNSFNVFNETITRYIQLDNLVNQTVNLNTNASRYNTLYISDINSLQNSAFSFGYITNTENTQNIINGIYDFLNNCVYKIYFKEKISDGEIIKNDYFYGKEIFDISLQDGRNIVYIKEEFLSSFLSNTIQDLSRKIKSSKRESLNNFITNISSSMSIRQIINMIRDYEDIVKDLQIIKKLEISVIPILKNISQSKSRGTDENNNIIFNPEVTTAQFINELNLNFINLFYDSNSSLSWKRFSAYKKAYFYNSEITSDSISLGQGLDLTQITLQQKEKASNLRPIWDYLFSGLYLNTNRKFSDVTALRIEDFFNTSSLEEINYVDINNFIVKKPMLGFENKYFDFSINNLNNISIKSTNLAINFNEFYNQDRSNPQNIRIFSETNHEDFYVDVNITNLKIFFSEQQIINQSKFLVKSSIHPLILNDNNVENNNIVTNVRLLGSSNLDFLTQSKVYMNSLDTKEGFTNFYKGVHNRQCTILRQGQSLILRINLPNLYNKSFYSYRDFFDQCKLNNVTLLKDFYVRVALNIKIENINLFFCMHKKIDRANLVNTDVLINNILSIESFNTQN